MNKTTHRFARAARVWLSGLLGLGIALAGFGAEPVQAAAPIYIVDAFNSSTCAPVYNGTAYINPLQSAINDAIANGVKTIELCTAPYPAFTVTGASKLTIKAHSPDPLQRPVINAPAAATGVVVGVHDSSGVVLDGLTIDGTAFTDSTSLKYGIVFSNSTGTIQNNTVRNVRSTNVSVGVSEFGIVVNDGDLNGKVSAVSIKNNLVAHYGNVGIMAFGAVKVTISGNMIDGADGDTTHGIPEAGIWATASDVDKLAGTVSKNLITYNVTGVRIEDVGSMSITGNTVQNTTGDAVSIAAVCFGNGMNGSKNKVSGNMFTDVIEGVLIRARATSASSCHSHADKNVISKNTIIASGLSQVVAIQILTVDVSGTYDAFADGNSISGNTVIGFANLLSESGATGTKIGKNVFMGP